jgi:hypothetical protein
MFHCRRAVNDVSGALLPSDATQMLKSRFMPYLSTIVHDASRPRACVRISLDGDHPFRSKPITG